MPMTTPGKFDSNGAWDGFRGEIWQEEINVRDFIQKNYTPYDGDEAFLTDPTDRTQKLWNHVQKLQKEEREKGGVLECETEVVSGLTAYGAGYISEDMKELEQIVGLQTDKPLKRAFMPYGGIRMAVQAAETYGYEINPELKKIFTTYVTTHNDAVFGAYTPEMRLARKTHVVDSLSAIKYAKVKIIRDEEGITKDFEIEGDFPRYGNDDPRADEIATWLLRTFFDKIRRRHTYRDSKPSTSILTITSNVVYGEATGATPDGRKAYTSFAPGASPSYGAEQNGLLASLNSVAKIPYHWALDGISNTQTINPDALGHETEERKNNLVQILDGYFTQDAHHLNVNVFGTEKLIDAMEHPEKEEYQNFTIRVSGYAVKFISLTKKQQLDVIARTCHKTL